MPVSAGERFERFFQATSDCQFYVKPDEIGRFRYVNANPAALAVAGMITEDDLIGRTPVEVMGEDYGTTVERNIAEAFRRGQAFHFNGPLGAAGDGPVYDAYYHPLNDADGNVAGIFGTARDVSNITLLNERLLHAQKLEALGELAGSLTHDFDNILTVFGGALDYLSRDDLSPEQRNDVTREARKSLQAGVTLTRRLTSFARKERIHVEAYDVEQLVSSCLFMMQRMLGKRIILSVRFEPDLWRVRCNRSEFEIAMMNLATNARDAIEAQGEVIISVGNRVRQPQDPSHYPDKYVEIVVSDTGCGMTRDVAQKAIEPFYSTKPEGTGTGLGLSGIAKFVADIGGAIRIESEPGMGTSVAISLMIADAPPSAARPNGSWDPGANQ